MEISAWQLWVIAGLGLGALEIKLSGFVMAWFAVGAMVAAGIAALGLGLTPQVLTFSVVSLGLFAASRTIFHSVLMRAASSTVKVGAEAMLGAEATVVEALPATGNGTVRINGELWHARSLDGAIAAGSTVVVDSVDGLRLKVRRSEAGPLVVREKERQ